MKSIVKLFVVLFTISSFAQIADNAEDVSPLLIGEKIPSVILHDTNGIAVNTKEVFSKKTVVVVYRGGWCPYCNAQLADMQDIEKEIIALGYQIVAISPDAPSFLKQTLDKNELQYKLYSDSEGVFAQAIGVAFKKDKPKLDKYSEGKNPGFLPVPTVYVINDNREIEFMYVNPSYATRLKGDVLLAVLKAL
jgi:peroxiredoxin